MIFVKLTVSHKANCCADLSPRRFAATYRLVCPGLKQPTLKRICSTLFHDFFSQENATEEQKYEFLDEIETMKVVGKNPNVLNFVGCWTTATPLRLIVEYIPHGDLLQWLRAKRSKVICFPP